MDAPLIIKSLYDKSVLKKKETCIRAYTSQYVRIVNSMFLKIHIITP